MISCLFYVVVYPSVSSFHNGPDIRFSEGERNSKEGAFIRTALNGYRTARQFQNPFRNRKSQAISATSQLPCPRCKFSNIRLMVSSHPSQCPYRKSLPPQNQEKLHRSGDAASCRRKLDGVLKEVQPDLHQQIGIAEIAHRRQVDIEIQILIFPQGFQHQKGLAYLLIQLEQSFSGHDFLLFKP